MQPGIPLKWPPNIYDIVGIVLSLIIVFFLICGLPAEGSSNDTPSSAESQNSQNLTVVTLAGSIQTSPGLPIRLKIPKINVDSAIEYVGLAPDGTMDIPKSPDDVAWLDLGPRPGEEGSAVIAGHYGWKEGKAAVFDNLSKLQKGDKIYVEDEDGAIIIFVVRELRTYGKNEDASDVFISSDGKAHLNLITCEGVWNKDEKSFSNRLVVFTDKAEDETI